MTLAQDFNWYSISGPLTGDAQVRDLVLTGWGNVLATFSVGGVMFWKVTTGNSLEIYSDAERTSLVCSGSISASDRVTLAAYSGGPISGTATVIHTNGLEATGRIIVAYGDEPDLEDVLQSSANFLSSSQWRGINRFEKAFNIAKQELDSWIDAALLSAMPRRPSNEIDRAMLANPVALRGVHALLAAAVILGRRASLDDADVENTNRMRKMAREMFNRIRIEQDYTDTGTVSTSRVSFSNRIGRG